MKNAIPLLCFALALAGGAANAAKPRAAIEVMHPWIAQPPGGAMTAAGYVTLKNDGLATDTLLGASTPAAETLELHSMSMTGGIMRMRPMAAGVAIAPGGFLAITPAGGYHLMLIRPRHPLKRGERVPVILTFAKAGPVKTTFTVEAAAR